MKALPLRRLVDIYAACFAAFIVYASGATIVDSHRGGGSHGPQVALALAGAEILAAVAFALRPARRIAAVVLLVVFAMAAGLTAASGRIPANLAFYALTTVMIVLLDRAHTSQRAVA